MDRKLDERPVNGAGHWMSCFFALCFNASLEQVQVRATTTLLDVTIAIATATNTLNPELVTSKATKQPRIKKSSIPFRLIMRTCHHFPP